MIIYLEEVNSSGGFLNIGGLRSSYQGQMSA